MSIRIDEFNKQCYKFVSKFQEWTIKTYSDKFMLVKNDIRLVPDKSHVLTWEYHVIYSESYEVPVIYFCASNQSGVPLDLEQTLFISNRSYSREDLSRAISQVEHPFLFRPFFMVHPCKTKNFMQPHIDVDPDNYLICWLSTIGTIIGLKLDC